MKTQTQEQNPVPSPDLAGPSSADTSALLAPATTQNPALTQNESHVARPSSAASSCPVSGQNPGSGPELRTSPEPALDPDHRAPQSEISNPQAQLPGQSTSELPSGARSPRNPQSPSLTALPYVQSFPALLSRVEARLTTLLSDPNSKPAHIKALFDILLRAEHNQLAARRLDLVSVRNEIASEPINLRAQSGTATRKPQSSGSSLPANPDSHTVAAPSPGTEALLSARQEAREQAHVEREQTLHLLDLTCPTRLPHPGWPAEKQAAVEAAIQHSQLLRDAGVSGEDYRKAMFDFATHTMAALQANPPASDETRPAPASNGDVAVTISSRECVQENRQKTTSSLRSSHSTRFQTPILQSAFCCVMFGALLMTPNDGVGEIPKTYEPAVVESKWYQYWLEHRCFLANSTSPKPAYSIVIPPPNVTGILHMGHVLNNTIQDILARKARMEGKEVLWLPGTDHAGISTQVQVEKRIKKEEGKTRRDLGREEFLRRVWEWKEKHGGIIIEQLKKLGCSCDWSRERFTMDPAYSRRVAESFVDLYHKGLIYRGNRMVNWCPATQTALSDEEVIMKAQNGLMYYFQVEVAEQPGTFLTIATTRPETIPGDTAVAVNPKDPRYANLIGKHVLRPLPAEFPREKKLIPIIGDEQVDFEFGTGVLKVTPAHDKADFDIGQRHHLPLIDIMNPDATMNDLAGEDLRGTDRFKARKIAAEKLKEIGAWVKEEPYQNNVGFSERADVPIEPRLSDQWFLKYPQVPRARQLAQTGELKFFPERWHKVYDHWLENIHDWCISRQLWWGHRIPVWYRGNETRCQVDSPGPDWEQDPDVLDTWCSSWLWPFATMDDETLAKFYPTTVLVTAPEILFFWVARMIMAGLEYTGQKPFSDVYLTGIVRDKIGRKMSKTLGNSPDPLDLIAKYSADAVRFGTMRSAPLGQDILFDEQQVELGRNFCTKLWNACRFRQMQGGDTQGELKAELLTSDDKWILFKLDAAIREMSDALAGYKFNEATQALYRFFWGEFCDWYLETTKAVFFSDSPAQKASTLAVLDFILSHSLRLMHPFLPFVTEELWHALGYHQDMPANQGGESIMFAPWPKDLGQDFRDAYNLDETDQQFANAKYELVTQGRNMRREQGIQSSKKVKFVFRPPGQISGYETEVLRLLLNAETVEVVGKDYQPPKGTPSTQTGFGDLFLPLEGVIDMEAERVRLTREMAKIDAEIQKVEQKLNNPNFTEKVPPAVLEEHKKRLADWQGKKAQVQTALHAIAGS